MTHSAIVVHAGEGEVVPDPLGLPRLAKALAQDTRGAYTLHESVRSPGQGAPTHVHDDHEEAFYVLDGVVDFIVNDEHVTAMRGTFILVPRGTAHAFAVTGEAPASYLCLFSPPRPG